ncbi:amino acid permease/ SLC12A domain-containing protein [Syncephalis fuscata]|nr:amino acid permease/ SLC12A domain-containing protein [Syncephalis fuscata]
MPNQTPDLKASASITSLPASLQDAKNITDNDDQQNLHKGLRARHLTMISLGGTIGTGLFLASGSSIFSAGPAGALLAYVLMGCLVYFMMISLGEMATYMPTAGSMNTYIARFVDPSLGFAFGWNYWYSWATTLAVELVAAGVVMRYWLPQVPVWVWSLIVLIIVLSINLISVRGYGEAEYWFSLIKVVTVVIFIFIAFLVVCGVGRDGPVDGSTFKDGMAFKDGVRGVIGVFLVAGFSFQGTELVGVAAGESARPRRDVPRAIRQVFWRILLFYVLSMLLIGLLVPSTDEQLLSGGDNVSVSPFTLTFQKIGISVAAHIMNAVILTVVLSAGNSSLYASSRTLYVLAQEGKAPKLFARVNKRGVPVYALLLTTLIGALAFLCSLFNDQTVYLWLLSLSGVSGFISWMGIAIAHIRFRRAYIAQGRSLDDLPYRASLYPFGPWFALVLGTLVILGQGYSAVVGVDEVDVSKIVMAYIGIPLLLALYIGHKLICKTKIVPLMEVDLDTGKSAAVGNGSTEMGEVPATNLNWRNGSNPLQMANIGWKQFRTTRVGRVIDNL